MIASRPLRQLGRGQDGVTIVEFALVAPVLLLALMGMLDLAFNMYTTAMLQGAIQKSARDATIEGASTESVDARVQRAVKAISANSTITISRMAYTSFSDVSRPEDYTDTNANGVCDAGEPFEDVNGNETWDSDRGTMGQGGARDAVLYTVQVTYPRMFPIAGFMSMPNTFTTTARTVLRNQPYGLQEIQPPKVVNCV